MVIHTRTKGNIGENVACTFLERKGFIILDRNYSRKWGELDIIGQKDDVIHFFEVKSVTDNFSSNSSGPAVIGAISSEISDIKITSVHKPEENVHGLKIRHIRRMVETYLAEEKYGLDVEFQFHILSVYMNEKTRRARVKWLKNVIL